MPFAVQVTFDSHDPHALADWWAETLGWEVEVQDESFIRRMIAEGAATEDQAVIHQGRLVWREGAAINHPGGGGPRILFQLVPEPKTVKNRVHLDLRPDQPDVAAIRERLLNRGATELWTASQGPHSWTTMADPEGNEFCI